MKVYFENVEEPKIWKTENEKRQKYAREFAESKGLVFEDQTYPVQWLLAYTAIGLFTIEEFEQQMAAHQ